MRLGEMRRHPSYTYLRSAKKMVQKNDERQNKACQRSKKTTKQVVVVGPPIKKRLGKMRLGEMRLGEMLPNLTDSDNHATNVCE